MPTAEFVRERVPALARAPKGAVSPPVPAELTPLIERMFRYTWFLATERRDAMVREGRGDEPEKLVAKAWSLQESLRGDALQNRIRRTASDSEDSGGMMGWSIENTGLHQARSAAVGTGAWTSSAQSSKIRVNGTANLPAVPGLTVTAASSTAPQCICSRRFRDSAIKSCNSPRSVSWTSSNCLQALTISTRPFTERAPAEERNRTSLTLSGV